MDISIMSVTTALTDDTVPMPVRFAALMAQQDVDDLVTDDDTMRDVLSGYGTNE